MVNWVGSSLLIAVLYFTYYYNVELPFVSTPFQLDRHPEANVAAPLGSTPVKLIVDTRWSCLQTTDRGRLQLS